MQYSQDLLNEKKQGIQLLIWHDPICQVERMDK